MRIEAIILALCVANSFAQKKNIVKLAEELGATTLVSYVRTAGLEGALAGPGKFLIL